MLANSKNYIATTISLLPLGTEEFYATIVPEESKRGIYNNLWIFRNGCGVAQFYTGSLADNNDPKMTSDGIRALDSIGQFDDIKELLIELE